MEAHLNLIWQAVSLLDDLDKELNNYIMRCREWWGSTFTFSHWTSSWWVSIDLNPIDETTLRHATDLLKILSLAIICPQCQPSYCFLKVRLALPRVGKDHHRQPCLRAHCGVDGDQGQRQDDWSERRVARGGGGEGEIFLVLPGDHRETFMMS